MPRNYHKSYTPLTPDPNGLFQDQTAVGAGDLTLNGAGVTAGVWTTSDELAHQMSLESTGNLSGVTFTITGTDAEGKALTEAVTGPNNSTVESANYFYTVTSVAVDGAVGTNVEGGPVDEAISKIYPVDRLGTDQYTIAVDITGTLNYDIEYTFDDVYISTTSQGLTFTNHSELVNETTSQNSYIEAMPTAFRFVLNSYTAGCTAKVNYIPNGR